MKAKLFVITLLVIVLSLASMAFTPLPAPEVPPAPTLPDWALFLITAGATWLVTNGIKSLVKVIPWLPDLSGWGTTVVAALVNGAVLFGNGFLASLPPTSYPAVTAVLVFLGTLFSSYGLHYVMKQFVPRSLPQG